MRLFALDERGLRRELQVEDVWPHKGLVVLKFAGVDSIDDAEMLAGCELQVPLAERAELPLGAHYISDLIGCMVFDQGREVGPVADVTFGAGEAPLLVVRRGKEEHLLPLAEDFLEALDVAKKEIRMKLPEGMLEVNAPLSDEEKRAQGQK
jgi:16S rRNA processing protein RimM